MKNVLQIIPSPSWGGGERYVYDLSEGLLGRGYNVVFSGRKGAAVEPIFAKLAPYYPLKLSSMFDFGSVLALRRVIKASEINIIHVHIFKHAFLAALAAKFSGREVKIVMTRHLVRRGKGGFLYNWLYKKLSTIIFVSELARDEFLSGAPSIAPHKVCVVHNSVKIPSKPVPAIDFRAKHSLNPNTLILGYSGRLAQEKGIDIVLDAMSAIDPRAVLVIAGGGDDSYKVELESYAQKLGVGGRVFFEGFISNIYEFVCGVDIAVLPSRAREAGSLSVIEYISQGVPIVVTNNGSQKEIIENRKNGILIDPESPAQLASAVNEIIADSELRESLSQNGIAKSREFSAAKYVDKIETIYNQTEKYNQKI